MRADTHNSQGQAQEALGWYFGKAHADLGERAMPLEPTTRSQGIAPTGPDDSTVDAATRYGAIEAALDSIGRRPKRVLAAMHSEQHPCLRPFKASMGVIAPVALVLFKADKILPVIFATHAKGAKAVAAQVALRDLGGKARDVYTKALKAFAKALEASKDRKKREWHDKVFGSLKGAA